MKFIRILSIILFGASAVFLIASAIMMAVKFWTHLFIEMEYGPMGLYFGIGIILAVIAGLLLYLTESKNKEW